jgi:glutaminase
VVGNWTHWLEDGVSALWGAGVAGKALAVSTGWIALSAPDPNVYLNLFTILLVVLVAWPVARTKRKDATIKDLQDAVAAKDARNKELSEGLHASRQQVRQLEQGSQHLKTELARIEGAHEELQKYTAQPAIEQFQVDLAAMRAELAERHTATLDAMHEQTRALALIAERVNSG